MREYENIVLVCLDGNFSRSLSEILSDKLDMLFADLKEYIEYDLVDSNAILETCGVEYLRDREYKSTKSFAKFKNSVLTVDYNLFKQNRYAFTQTNFLVYLRLPEKLISKEEAVNIISFSSRDEYLKSECKLTIDIKTKTKNKAIKQILDKIGEAI